MNTTTSYLDGSSQNSKTCTSVFTDLSSKHSSATFRAAIGNFHSRGHNSGLFSRPDLGLSDSTADISSTYTENMCSTRFCSLLQRAPDIFLR